MRANSRALALGHQVREFRNDVWAGLSRSPKQLSCKYFYDKRGSELFDRICLLDEYYLTRAELAITERYAGAIGEQVGDGVMLVEFGSGSSVKTRYLLDALPRAAAYVPVDISGEHLQQAAAEIAADYPRLEVLPVCADFTEPFQLPLATRTVSHVAVYFPGSTIGNFVPNRAAQLLGNIAELCGRGGGLLIGIDLKKDPAKIHAAYNDAAGVTAEFNLNLLRRINRELDGDFDLAAFEHRAIYSPERGRVEIDLVSTADQTVSIAGRDFEFTTGETIRTEYSHKYTVEEFSSLAAQVGFALHHEWADDSQNFAVLHFVVE
jgi:dimethylhistidine N-methyltransferase